jgi:CSLREA domain-containing protein
MLAILNRSLARNGFLLPVLFSVCLLFGVAWKAEAATTYTVTKTADTNDGVCDADCSLREAIVAANANPGLDNINFSIGSGLQTIKPTSELPALTDPVVINGTTQPGFAGSPIIEIDGSLAGDVGGINIQGGNSTVRGLIVNGFRYRGIQLTIGDNNVVAGNYVGTNATGSAAHPVQNNGVGILVYSANNVIGGTTAADRNIIGGNSNDNGSVGLWLYGPLCIGNIVKGNYIGTDVTGTVSIPHGNLGMWITTDATLNTVGGPNPADRNIISGNSSTGLGFTERANHNKVQGNYIGLQPNGTTPLPNGYGVAFEGDSHDNLIGGTNAGEGNLILSDFGQGVYAGLVAGVNNSILGNSIRSLNQIGIDLGFDGVTPNDSNDPDNGPNNTQNFPLITTADSSGGSTHIVGSLNSEVNKQYRVEFFANGSCDPSGNGDGEIYLGTTNVTTVGNNAAIDVTFPLSVASGNFITATATDPNGNTSEFSPCKVIGAAVPQTVEFSTAAANLQESLSAVTLTVKRNGNTNPPEFVDYKTNDGTATQKGDFEYAAGTLKFAAGEVTRTITVLINEDKYTEGNETFTVSLSNPTTGSIGAVGTTTITINDDSPESPTSPLEDPQSFVYTHYHDFLNREPDASGLNFWTNQILSCGGNAVCIDTKRQNVSAAFFVSVEFQETGYLVYRFYKAGYGNIPGAPVPLLYQEFMPDTQAISRGLVVGAPGWEQVLENNKQAFALDFVKRQRFSTAYPGGLTPDQFVDMLFANAGVVPTAGERQNAIDAFGGAGQSFDPPSRAVALRRVAENATLNQQEFNRAFVLMQYYGYLRRNPFDAPEPTLDYAGYNFWLNKLNGKNGNYITSQMVRSFLLSGEYLDRFGQ